MSLALKMVVRNEAHNLNEGLGAICEVVDEIVIVDTGSSDGTPDILQREFGAKVYYSEPGEDVFSITAARNMALSKVQSDWILVLDADERLSPSDMMRIRSATEGGESAYILPWRNTRAGTIFDDYKLSLFRNGYHIHYEDFVHPNNQQSVRRAGLRAPVLEDVSILHSLDGVTPDRAGRKKRLMSYVRQYPTWWRYHWFLGYSHAREEDWEAAHAVLSPLASARPEQFPVECLNAHLVLIEFASRRNDLRECVRLIGEAEAFHREVLDDFEVQANQHLAGWLAKAKDLSAASDFAAIRAYEFAY